jgi:hypothetical protein
LEQALNHAQVISGEQEDFPADIVPQEELEPAAMTLTSETMPMAQERLQDP